MSLKFLGKARASYYDSILTASCDGSVDIAYKTNKFKYVLSGEFCPNSFSLGLSLVGESDIFSLIYEKEEIKLRWERKF